MPTPVDGEGTFHARSRAEWRAWLARNHARAPAVWLLFDKKRTGRACVTLAEAVEEALCFGWIDGKLRRIDDERHALRFTPRRARSVWSDTNKERVRRLTRAGRMAEAGLAAVRAAKQSGAWRKAAGTARQEKPPPDLAAALAADARARAFFESLAPGYRRLYIAWVLDARRDETRRRRVERVADRCARGLKPGIDL